MTASRLAKAVMAAAVLFVIAAILLGGDYAGAVRYVGGLALWGLALLVVRLFRHYIDQAPLAADGRPQPNAAVLLFVWTVALIPTAVVVVLVVQAAVTGTSQPFGFAIGVSPLAVLFLGLAIAATGRWHKLRKQDVGRQEGGTIARV